MTTHNVWGMNTPTQIDLGEKPQNTPELPDDLWIKVFKLYAGDVLEGFVFTEKDFEGPESQGSLYSAIKRELAKVENLSLCCTCNRLAKLLKANFLDALRGVLRKALKDRNFKPTHEWSVTLGNLDVVNLQLSAIDNPTQFVWHEDICGRTALHSACLRKSERILTALLKATGESTAMILLWEDKFGNTALNFASELGNTNMVKIIFSFAGKSTGALLRKRNTHQDSRQYEGLTAQQIAQYNNHTETAAVLKLAEEEFFKCEIMIEKKEETTNPPSLNDASLPWYWWFFLVV